MFAIIGVSFYGCVSLKGYPAAQADYRSPTDFSRRALRDTMYESDYLAPTSAKRYA
jgi:hypothetical protein